MLSQNPTPQLVGSAMRSNVLNVLTLTLVGMKLCMLHCNSPLLFYLFEPPCYNLYPPCPRTALRKNRPLVPRSNSCTTFFDHRVGFFMVLVDAGQLFRCAQQHFMCVATGPPIRGDPIGQSQVHIPLKPLPPALDPLPRSNQPLTRKQTKVS